MKILFADVADWEEETIRRRLSKHKLILVKEPINESDVKDADALCVFVSSQVTFKIIRKMPKLKLIVARSTGYDNIDIKECARRKITVCNVPNYGDNTVAEHTFALLLALTRKIVTTAEHTRKCNFDIEELRGIDLKGKTIGVIGAGKIGKNVIKIAKGFQMNVIAFDKYPDKAFAGENGFRYVNFSQLLAISDVISLHTPLTKETFHLIDKNALRKIKKGAIIINTARGALIETDALVKGLKTGIFSAAGIDVLENEGDLKNEDRLLSKKYDFKKLLEQHIMLEMDNVIITPHNAFNSREAVSRLLNTAIDNIISYGKGMPINVTKK